MRIENRIEVRAPVDQVYDALTDLDNIPKYFPGIREAHVKSVKHGLVGTRIDMTTTDGKHTIGEIKRAMPRRALLLEDARGITEEFILHKTPNGTTQVEEIITAPEGAGLTREAASEKLQGFVREIEGGA